MFRREKGRSEARLWEAVRLRLEAASIGARDELARDVAEPVMLGEPYLVRPRLGQGSFRVLVTDTYGRRCAVTGEKALPVLDAAHIRAVREGGQHRLDNGLLLPQRLLTLPGPLQPALRPRSPRRGG